MYSKTNVQNEILKGRKKSRGKWTVLPLDDNWNRDSHDRASSAFLQCAIHLPGHTAKDITTWKVHPTFNFCDSSKFHIVITLPRHTSITRLEYFTYIFVILGRELAFSSQCNLHECKITSSVQYSQWTYLKLIIAMNFTYLLFPRGRLHLLLIRLKKDPQSWDCVST